MNTSLTDKCLIISLISLITLAGCSNVDNNGIDQTIQGEWKDSTGAFKMIIAESKVTKIIKITSDTTKLTVKSIQVMKKDNCAECKSLILKVIYDQDDAPNDTFTFYNFTPKNKETLQLKTDYGTYEVETLLLKRDLK